MITPMFPSSFRDEIAREYVKNRHGPTTGHTPVTAGDADGRMVPEVAGVMSPSVRILSSASPSFIQRRREVVAMAIVSGASVAIAMRINQGIGGRRANAAACRSRR